MFSNRSVSILVATDVAARGLDIDGLDMVINTEIARDMEAHVHRVGRTGRGEQQGVACTLVTEQQQHRLERLQQYIGHSLEQAPLPDEQLLRKAAFQPQMVTLQIDGGKRQKLRPTDILGALTADPAIDGKHVGKIKIAANWAYVAVDSSVSGKALQLLSKGKLKGRQFRARLIQA